MTVFAPDVRFPVAMFYTTLLLLTLPFPSQARPSLGTRPGRTPRVEKPLYDSTKMNLSYSPGISHKTTMQAASTYGKIGAHQPLNHADSAFLRQWSPAIIGAPDNPNPPVVKPKR